VIARTAGVAAGRRQSERLNALNVGGGARWFFLSHLAFGFDLRLHRIASGVAGSIETAGSQPQGDGPIEAPAPPPPTPGQMILIVNVGLSVR
jgi:hypothetical protein